MKKGLFMVSVCAILALASCTKERIKGNGPISTETRSVSGFSAISASGSTKVYITQGANFKVEIKGYSNLLPYFETKLVNNTLQLGYRQGANVSNDNTEVFITLPALTGLSLAGSGDIYTTGVFNSNNDFVVSIAGSGSINFSSGTCTNFNSRISGSGNINALDMICVNATTETDGSGNTSISASARLSVRIAGSGNVYYRGTPVIVTTISGSGAIIPR